MTGVYHSDRRVMLSCEVCGVRFDVSERHARLIRNGVHPSKCRQHATQRKPRQPPDDSDRRFWLERFSDCEIAEFASAFYLLPMNVESVASWRSVLLPAQRAAV